jgi:hypothetical protein
MRRVRHEIGSMFHWEPEFSSPTCSWPCPAVYYSLCRHAIFALCAAQPRRPVLWLPSFFCPEVARFCRDVAIIREYRDDCRWPEPDWPSLQPSTDDLVLAVNYFGVRGGEHWRLWRNRCACVLIEDHTQDPFSAWARQSNADYAVCSIRKTLPVPDGAILWSPAGHPLPRPCDTLSCNGSWLKAAAMLYKQGYLSGALGLEVKTEFRKMQLRGESELSNGQCSRISPMSAALLSRGAPQLWREQRNLNTRELLKLLENWEIAQPVYTTWPSGHAPFTFPLVFEDEEQRNFYQDRLRQEEIYCAVEWVCDTPDNNARDLSARILSIPIDHRYGREEMRRIADVLTANDIAYTPYSTTLGAHRLLTRNFEKDCGPGAGSE